MKLSIYRSLKKIYRQEPITAVIFIMAVTDIFLGGKNEHWGLLSLGLFMTIIAILLHRLKGTRIRKSYVDNRSSRLYLTPISTPLTPLPPLKRKRDYQ